MIRFDPIDPTDPTDNPLAENNTGLFVKPDGSVRAFNTYDLVNNTPSEAEKATNQKVMALIVALKVPAIMNILLEMAADPAIVGDVGATH